MNGTLLILRAEAFRFFKSRGAKFAGAFLFVVPILRVWAAYLGEQAAKLDALAAGGKALGLEQGRGWAPLVEGWRAGLALGSLLLLIHGARSLAGDRESGLLRLATTRTAARPALVIGRVLLGPLLVFAVASISGAGAWLGASYWFDFGALMEDGYVFLEAEELQNELAISVLAALPALWGMHVFGLLVSSLARGATSAVAMAVALMLAFDLFKDAIGQGQYWLFAAYAPSFVDSSAMKEMAGVARGFSDAGYPSAVLRMNFLLPWPQILALVLLSIFATSRRRL